MFEIPEDILGYFFEEINKKGKYITEINGNRAIIRPRKEEEYYKPNIIVKNLLELEEALLHYIESLNEFYLVNNNLEHYHDLSYFFNNLLFNMTVSDADNLADYINKRSYFFTNEQFKELSNRTAIFEDEKIKIFVKRVLENPGLETPFVLIFTMELDGKTYRLPLVRYAFDENDTCHLFAIQYGRNREGAFSDNNYKGIVNQANSGVAKYRNVSPSFVLVFTLFLKLLSNYNIKRIMVPDFLFGRYRHYFGANTVVRSNEILERILDNFLRLIQRMELQIEGFKIECYPNDFDSYTHIQLDDINTKNQFLKRILKKD